MDRADLISVLRAVEWNGVQQGQGSGFMSSGGDGPLFPACPYCRGLKEPNGHFIASAVGHRPTCIVGQALKEG